MRVIAGSAKGRKLFTPGKLTIRPTPDKVKGALFNILGTSVKGSSFLDLFSGTGAVGIEAISRGARSVTFIEQDRRAMDLLRRNLKRCDFDSGEEIHISVKEGEAVETLRDFFGQNLSFDIIFLDPPYQTDLADKVLDTLAKYRLLGESGSIIVEHSYKKDLSATIGNIMLVREYRYGDTGLSRYSMAGEKE